MRVFLAKLVDSSQQLSQSFLSTLEGNLSKLANQRRQVVTLISTTYTLVETDSFVIYTGTGSTLTLPSATAFDGYTFAIKHAGSGVLTISATSTGQIFTTALVNTFNMAAGDAYLFMAGNASWQRV